jgi:hypothetical protein
MQQDFQTKHRNGQSGHVRHKTVSEQEPRVTIAFDDYLMAAKKFSQAPK